MSEIDSKCSVTEPVQSKTNIPDGRKENIYFLVKNSSKF